MKKLKKLKAVFIMVMALAAVFQSCKKSADKPNYSSDKTKLAAETDSLTAVYNAAVEGKQAGDYVPGSKAALQTALSLAKSVADGQFTQQQVNNAVANLMRAAVQFNVNLIQQISAANLVASWKFDGDAKDASGNGHDGQLKTGWVGPYGVAPTDGGTLPVPVADRYGVANKAYDFKNAAYVEVPFDLALRPSSFTICVWVKPHISSDGNYIFSLDRWNGYKFQLQGGNLPFLTVLTSTGYHDQDDGGPSVPLETWTHLVVSFTNGTEKFYINGALVKTADVSGDPVALSSPPPLAIGNELPKSAYNLTDPNSPNAYYGGNFFVGSIDDLHLYNKVLSDNEVKSLYTMEQP
ncbi:LamG domain-containing protein [uncultured Mucilaginibacter sp.]|uniref:LamG domain-containing protein n=1 Tax=uncultured Mucilaginibacter sp. TaxID=797541 RepID=UPI0025EBDBE0|nr:LamG domain-containing protein [uncultured Mucilaginibacter sp.]